ncbi:MAG: response regulator [Thermodesulfobacteriota bacterium]|nr:response regulator [Thermodesulfobacteriota bacterium]
MKILVVDDEIVSRKKLQKIMENICECEAVNNGEAALMAAFSENPPDLILLDIMMPGIDGYEVCRRLKADRKTADIPVIFISGKKEQEDEARGLELGVVDYITKPFSRAIIKSRVQTHLELKKHRDHLKELVKERTNELMKVNEQLQQAQKMEAIGTMAGGIAHDFNNILYPIIGFTEMTIDDVPEESIARSNLEEILKAAKRARDLVQQILTFSRQTYSTPKPFMIQPVLKEALKLLRASLPSSIEIRHDIDTHCGPVLADPTQIHQVIMNLCTNAFHAMREKGGVLEVTLTDVQSDSFNLRLKPDMMPGPYLKLTVSDTGHGIDPAVLKRIFNPFFTTKGPGEGTGLGLSVVHGIVKSSNGHIDVDSAPGKGSTFNVYLPLILGNDRLPESEHADSDPEGTESILLVDDEAPIIRMVNQMLERLGYFVTARTSSIEALETFRLKPDSFDLVITDQTMPNMNGTDLAQKLLEIKPDIPVILCTGFSEAITEEKAKAMGIQEYILKPVDKSMMSRAIRRALER